MELVIASLNLSKVQELRAILEELLPNVHIRSLLEFPPLQFPQESNRSFEDNASAKAVYAANTLDLPTLADDSGLVVPALGGCEESFRRKQQRQEGKKLPDTKRLLSDLQHKTELDREAFLECAIAFAIPQKGLLKVASARIEGSIALQEHGPATFDFASLFVKHDYGKTLAEIPQAALARISHRRRACEKLAASLRVYFGGSAETSRPAVKEPMSP